MHPTLLFFLLLAALLARHAAHAAYEPAACGNLTVSYPFWLSNSSSSCGHPAFKISCGADGVAILRGSFIHVLHINYNNSSFRARHTGVTRSPYGSCPPPFNVSSSIALSPFRFSRSNRNLCFPSGCGNSTKPPDFFPTTNCSNSNDTFAYLGGTYNQDNPPAVPGRCARFSYMPVLGLEAAVLTAANYSQLLKDGFLLEWEVAVAGDCSACTASDGRCGSTTAR